MENEAAMPKIEESNWSVHWRVSESSGLMVYLVDYRGRRVLWEGSLPYVTIDHQRQEIDVDEESGEHHGPFWMPLGLRSLAAPTRLNRFRGGFELAADFETGPYRYTQMWRFHEDGRLSPLLTLYGLGLHDGHTYHPHWRFDFDIDGRSGDAVEHFQDNRWTRVKEEGWFPHSGESSEEGAAWRQVDLRTGSSVAIRPHMWEDAELFAIRYHEGEGAPFTPHSGMGAQPYPAAYAGSESLEGEDVTLWYVAHVHFDAAFPLTAGPWIQTSWPSR